MEIIQRRNKYVCYDKFIVKEIAYNESNEIIKLVIKNDRTGNDVFTYTEKKQEDLKEKIKLLDEFNKLVIETNTDVEKIKEHYKVESTDKLTIKQILEANETMKKKVK